MSLFMSGLVELFYLFIRPLDKENTDIFYILFYKYCREEGFFACLLFEEKKWRYMYLDDFGLCLVDILVSF